jgi:hypothetical protein
VKVETTNDVPVRILEVQAQKPAPYLTVNSRPDGKNAWVDLAFNGREVPADQQVGTETIIVRTSNASVPTLPILVQWDLLSAVSVEPANVVWVETAGLAHKATLTLTQTSGKPFRILSARTTHPLLQVDLGEKGASAIHRIQMGLAAEAKAGAYTEKVRLTLDDPDQPELEIRVSAALR